MCDFQDGRHNCLEFPQLEIEICHFCKKKTCGSTRICHVEVEGVKYITRCKPCSDDPNNMEEWIRLSGWKEPIPK